MLGREEELIELLNHADLNGLEDVLCGDALVTEIYNLKSYKLFNSLKEFLFTIFFFKIQVKLKKDYSKDREIRSIIAIFSPSYGERMGFETDFDKLIGYFRYGTYIVKKNKSYFSFRYTILLLRLFSWVKKLKTTKLNLATRVRLCTMLLQGFISYKELKRKIPNINHTDLLVTFCDVHPIDSVIIQKYKKSIKTATLQHAAFSHKVNGYAYSKSHSDYFLGISEYSKKEAVLSGYTNIDNYFVCGPLKYLGHKVKECSVSFELNNIGVALSGPKFDYENTLLIESALEVAKSKKARVVFRSHPALSQKYSNIYKPGVDISYNAGEMDGFIDSCDLFITGTTNTFADLLTMNKIAYRLVMPGKEDIFEIINGFKFGNVNELNTFIDEILKNPTKKMEELKVARKLLCPEFPIERNYVSIIEKIIES